MVEVGKPKTYAETNCLSWMEWWYESINCISLPIKHCL